MRIILNFLPLKTGGGMQVALDLLKQVEAHGGEHEWFVVAREGTAFEEYKDTGNVKTIKLVRDSLLDRLFFEHFGCQALLHDLNPDVIYTQFGPSWPGARSVRNVVGCAYSNLFYPEIDFWAPYPWYKQLERKFVDYFRLKRLKIANLVVFETKDLSERSVLQGVLEREQSTFVQPAVSSNVIDGVCGETREQLLSLPEGIRVCLVSTFSVNKNFDFLIEILDCLALVHKRTDISFVVTLPPENPNVIELLRRADEKGVSSQLINIGPVSYQGCAEVYKACDAAILPANLESFSNNIAESWAMRKPLFITDRSWARSICGDAAIYIDINNPRSVASSITEVLDSQVLIDQFAEEGQRKLREFPTSEERFRSYLGLITKVSKVD